MSLEAHQRRTASIALRHGLQPNDQDWSPQPAQEKFLRCGAFECFYGGAAGGGKSDALLAWVAGGVGRGYGRAYQGLLLRRTFPELEKSLVRRSFELYPRLGGRDKNGGGRWDFPGGETILLEHCENEKDILRYQGAPFSRVGFDEVTTFTEYQYRYMFSRVRSAVKQRGKGIRATGNPGGPGHQWVRRRWLNWCSRLAKKPARSGEIRWYAPDGNDGEIEVDSAHPHARSRSYIPARLSDNAILDSQDPDYRRNLEALPRLERLRLRDGDWDEEPSTKDYWNRTLCKVLGARPAQQEVRARCRSWDFGASEGGDPSAGVLLALHVSGMWIVEHVVHFQGGPDRVHAEFKRWAEADRSSDPRTIQTIPQDPGAAGKITAADFKRRNSSLPIFVVVPTGDKITRFFPAASTQLSGGFAVVDDGSWDVPGYHAELEAAPKSTHDDRMDATSDAYNTLASMPLEEDEGLILLPQ